MDKINFINGQAPSINAGNLNQMQTNAETSINEVANNLKDYIKTVAYKTDALSVPAGSSTNATITTSVPEGYSWLGYIITDNGWNADILSSIIKSDETKCVVNAYNIGSATKSPTISIKGIYIKNL